MKRLTVEIDDKLHQRAKAQAYSEAKTIKAVIIQLLEKWIKNGTTKNV